MTTGAPSAEPGRVLDPTCWVDRHGDYLFRYALSRLGERAAAEDAVQETLLAGLQARGSYEGRASERSWLTAILKRKVVDHIRRARRSRVVEETGGDPSDALFDERGMWKSTPAVPDGDPAAALETREFWEAFRRCLAALPRRLADAFALRELEELDTEEIRQVLEVSATNLWVMLYRARMRLWRCLQAGWFGAAERGVKS
jgi:RNA polymerase sigma-70 factor (ECF subfamily)